jgi:hypothetical protein
VLRWQTAVSGDFDSQRFSGEVANRNRGRSDGGRSSSRQQDALLPLLLDQQGGGLALDGNGATRRGLNRGDQSPSFRFREQPPM